MSNLSEYMLSRALKLYLLKPFTGMLMVVLLLASHALITQADETGRLVRAGIYNSPPAIFLNDEGQPDGFWPQLLQHIAEKEGWQLQWLECDWAQCLNNLKNNQIDVMPDTIINSERLKQYAFSNETVRVSWSRVYADPIKDIQTILDLEGQRVSVLAGSANYKGQGGIADVAKSFNLDVEFVELPTEMSVLASVESGVATAAVVSKDLGSVYERDFNVQRTPIILQPVDLRFAFTKDVEFSGYLIDTIDRELRELKSRSDSRFYQLLEQWLMHKPVEDSTLPSWFYWLLVLAVIVILLLIAGSLVMRLRVRQRTIELRKEVRSRRRSEGKLRESEQRLQSIIDNAPSLVFVKDYQGKYLLVNTLFEKMLNLEASQIMGKTDFDFFPAELAQKFSGEDKQVIEKNTVLQIEEQLPAFTGIGFCATTKFPLYDKGEPYAVCGITTDITERKNAETLQLSQQKVLEQISRGDQSLEQILKTIIELTESHTPDIHGSILLLEGTKLRHGAAPSLPAAYVELIDGLEIGPQVGSCGSAAYLGERVIVEDVQLDPKWQDFRDLAKQHGFRACWSEPIMDSHNNVLGTFAVYRAEPGAPDKNEIRMTEAMVHVASIAIEQERTKEQLASAEEEWVQALDYFEDVVYLTDMDRNLVRANRVFYDRIERTPDECIGLPIIDLIHADNEGHDRSICPSCQLQDSGQEGSAIMEADDPNNLDNGPIEIRVKLVKKNTGETTGMLVSVRDLTQQRQMEERLRLSASVFENTSEGVVISDTQGTVVEVNSAFTEILGYGHDEVIGQNPRMWKSDRHDESFYRDFWNSLMTVGRWRGEIWNRRKDGSVFPEWLSISQVVDSEGKLTHFIGVFTDISHLKESQKQLDHLAHHDALTDLPNRLLYVERLTQAIKHAGRQKKQLAIIFIDLDRFKNINDSLGHPAGDQLLCKVAERLEDVVREDDTVARISGDEFVLLLEDIGGSNNAAHVAQKVMRIFESSFQLEGREVQTSASLGISLYPQDGDDAATLLRNADAAMYRAKDEGRNNYEFYTEELTRNAFERVLLENSLRQALDQQQFQLYYQPQVDIFTGEIIGAEVLIRWQHPDQGMVSPAKFIPIAEECGLILAIGEWVLREACEQGKRWLDQDIHFGQLAVNVSGVQIKDSALVEQVSTIINECEFPASCLELEITEGFIMQQAQFAISQLEGLRQLGLTLAIDDFGTGYSSLSYLKQLPIQKLKIDQSFIRDIPDDLDDMAISNAVIALGDSLDLKVIAEGVETKEQASFLKKAGCSQGQGFLYSRPVPAEDFEKLLTEKKKEGIVTLKP